MESSIHSVAERYLQLLGGDETSRRALLACAAALRLDDETARKAISIVVHSNSSADKLLRQIKGLGCVWQRWDGSWYLTEEVRSDLVDRLENEVSQEVQYQLREVLGSHAGERLARLAPDGQITAYHIRETRIELAYQKVLTPGREVEGGLELGEIWHQARGGAKAATEQAVEHLASELQRRVSRLPDEVLFIRGMAAYKRKDHRRAEQDFEVVYRNGRPGEIYAIAAYLLGRLSRDPYRAERAFRDSLLWKSESEHLGQVWHSLGHLLSKDRRSWKEAEDAFHKSLDLRRDSEHQGQVWHSLGLLLSKDQRRRQEAENAYHKSLDLLCDHKDQGQVWHSLGLLLKDQRRWKEAEDAFHKSLDLRRDSEHQAQVWHSLGLLLKDQRRWKEAEDAFHKSLDLRRDSEDQAQVWHSLGLLRAQQGNLPLAEEAYGRSYSLNRYPRGKAQVRASWALAIVELGNPSDHERARTYAMESIKLDPSNARTRRRAEQVLRRLES